MPEMSLQEALQTPEVKGILDVKIQEAVDGVVAGDTFKTVITEAVTAAVTASVTAQLPTIQESVRQELRAESDVRELHTEAHRLIEASALKGAAKQNLLDDYALVDEKPGRALALVECERDAEGKVTKTAKQVLAAQVDDDIKRQRNILREAAPTLPRSSSGSTDPDAPVAEPIDAEPPWAQRVRDKGYDPSRFGIGAPDPAPAT